MRVFFLIVLVLSFCVGCSGHKYENMLKENIGEMREYLMEGKDGDLSVSLILGVREKDYVINGCATESIEFGVLTFILENVQKYDVSIAKYVLTVGTSRYDGVLEQNPFDNSLVADIGKKIDTSSDVKAKLIIGDYVKEIELTLINKDFNVSASDVISMISKEYKQELSSFIIDGSFGGEVYIKIINDADKYKGDYYWYVNIVSTHGQSIGLIISPYTKEILAKNLKLKNNP